MLQHLLGSRHVGIEFEHPQKRLTEHDRIPLRPHKTRAMFMPIALRPGARSKALCHNLIGSRKRPWFASITPKLAAASIKSGSKVSAFWYKLAPPPLNGLAINGFPSPSKAAAFR